MKQALTTFLITVLILAVAVFAVWNFVPLSSLKYITIPHEKKLGASLTTINSTDLISSLPTTLNNNFNALNAGAVDTATTSMESLASTTNLSVIGTITTGVWNGTAIGVGYGGSGTTTFASNQLLLGNGGSGVGIVSGFGTTGQFLTSNGNDTAPSWQTSAIDQSLSYLWTGTHNFTTTALFTNFNASSTLVLNGISLSFPSTQGASSTALLNNGAGTLTWNTPDYYRLIATTTQQNMKTATTTIGTSDFSTIEYDATLAGMTGSDRYVMRFNDDGGTNYAYEVIRQNNTATPLTLVGDTAIEFNGVAFATTSPAYLHAEIDNVSGQRKTVHWKLSFTKSGLDLPESFMGTAIWNDINKITSIELRTSGESETNQINSGTIIRVRGIK